MGLAVVRGDGISRTEGFAFDAQERLARRWDDAAGTTPDQPSERLTYATSRNGLPGHIQSTLQLDPSHSREMMTYAAGDGSVVGTATRVPAGWALSALQRASPAAGLTEQLPSRLWAAAPQTSPAVPSFAALYGDAAPITKTWSSGLGRPLARQRQVQQGVWQREGVALQVLPTGLDVRTQDQAGRTTVDLMAADGRRLARTDGSGATTTYAYDVAGRLRRVELPGGS